MSEDLSLPVITDNERLYGAKPSITRTQAALRFGKTETTLDRWRAEGRLPCHKDRAGHVRIYIADVERLEGEIRAEQEERERTDARRAELERLEREGEIKQTYALDRARTEATRNTNAIRGAEGTISRLQNERARLLREKNTTTDTAKILKRNRRLEEIDREEKSQIEMRDAAMEASVLSDRALHDALVLARRQARVERAVAPALATDAETVLQSLHAFLGKLHAAQAPAGRDAAETHVLRNKFAARVQEVLRSDPPEAGAEFMALIEQAATASDASDASTVAPAPAPAPAMSEPAPRARRPRRAPEPDPEGERLEHEAMAEFDV